MSERCSIVVLGLSITSSWGNGHATTYRSLVRALFGLGHPVTFLERDVPWYAENRDAPRPPGCKVALYDSVAELEARHGTLVRNADAVIVGSYVPDGRHVCKWVTETATGLKLFYDIDTPVTIRALCEGKCEYLAAETVPKFDAYLSFTGGPTLKLIEERFKAPVAWPLHCSADPNRYVPLGARPRTDLGYLGTYSKDRQPALERLLMEPARRFTKGTFTVAGPCYPATISWPKNVERREHVGPCEHVSFYGAQRFTLNVTRADMVRMGYSPSVRLFEAAACGTPVISDIWEGIEQFFEPGREILLASTSNEVLEYLRCLGESEREAIGIRARRRVLSEHTGEHRAGQLVAYLRELAGNRTRMGHVAGTPRLRCASAQG